MLLIVPQKCDFLLWQHKTPAAKKPRELQYHILHY